MGAVRKHDEWLSKKLKDANFAAEYLNAAAEDDDPATYLAALRKIAEARGPQFSPRASGDAHHPTICH